MFSEAVNLVTETVDGVLGILRFLQTRHLKEGVTNRFGTIPGESSRLAMVKKKMRENWKTVTNY